VLVGKIIIILIKQALLLLRHNNNKHVKLGNLKQKCSWRDLMISILLVLNNFVKNLSTTKSNDLISDFFREQASIDYTCVLAYIYLKLAE